MRVRFVGAVVIAALLAACASDAGGELAADSVEVLRREPATDRAVVLHVLVGWAELEPAYGGRMDDRARTRTKDQADALAAEILERAREGEDFRSLMRTYSEDWATAENGSSYTATPTAQLVPPYRELSLRLEPGEIGVVETVYGWHVIERLE